MCTFVRTTKCSREKRTQQVEGLTAVQHKEDRKGRDAAFAVFLHLPATASKQVCALFQLRAREQGWRDCGD